MRPLMIIAGEKLVGEAERGLRMVEEGRKKQTGGSTEYGAMGASLRAYIYAGGSRRHGRKPASFAITGCIIHPAVVETSRRELL